MAHTSGFPIPAASPGIEATPAAPPGGDGEVHAGWDPVRGVNAVLCLASLALTVLAWLALRTSEDPGSHLLGAAPPGQAAYLACRWVGLLALVPLWAQVMVGILLRRAEEMPRHVLEMVTRTHRRLAWAALGTAALHPFLFALAVSQAEGHWAPLVPLHRLGWLALLLIMLGSAATAGRPQWNILEWLRPSGSAGWWNRPRRRTARGSARTGWSARRWAEGPGRGCPMRQPRFATCGGW